MICRSSSTSLTAELNRRDLAVHLVIHPILRIRRDPAGRLLAVAAPDDPADEASAESFMHVEVTHQPAPAMAEIEAAIKAVLADVRAAYSDWFATRGRLDDVIATLPATEPDGETDEARAFLEWLRENNFTFLGYRAYEFPPAEGGRLVRIVDRSGLGLLRDAEMTVFDELRAGEPVPPALARFLDREELLAVTKSHRRSTVHRAVPIDCIFVQSAAA